MTKTEFAKAKRAVRKYGFAVLDDGCEIYSNTDHYGNKVFSLYEAGGSDYFHGNCIASGVSLERIEEICVG